MLQAERHAAVLAVSSVSRKVDEYDWAVEEANRSLDLETSFLGAELERDREEEDMMEEVVKRLKDKEEELVRRLEEWREKSQVEVEVARTRLEHSETALETLEEEQNTTGDSLDTDEELKLLEKLKHCHEQLEAERRVFEDLEFRLMEEETRLEADGEEAGRETIEAEGRLRKVREQREEVELQQLQLSTAAEADVAAIVDSRSTAAKQLEMEKQIERQAAPQYHCLRYCSAGCGRR